MRAKLRQITSAKRHAFTATFERFGVKRGWCGTEKTVLFKDVKMGGSVVCDHLWFDCGKQFDVLDLNDGDEIEFRARVGSYTKGYKGRRDDVFDHPVSIDWRLERPTNVRKIYRDLGDGVLPLCALENLPSEDLEEAGMFC